MAAGLACGVLASADVPVGSRHEPPVVAAELACAVLVLTDGVTGGGQPGHGTAGSHPGGRHAARGAELVLWLVAGANVGAMVGLGVAATVGAAVGLGVANSVGDAVGPGIVVTVGVALGPGVGSVGEAPKAVEPNPAVMTKLSKTDAPKRVTRDDAILPPSSDTPRSRTP